MFGISTEASYPYTHKNGICHEGENSGINITSYVRVMNNEEALKEAIGKS